MTLIQRGRVPALLGFAAMVANALLACGENRVSQAHARAPSTPPDAPRTVLPEIPPAACDASRFLAQLNVDDATIEPLDFEGNGKPGVVAHRPPGGEGQADRMLILRATGDATCFQVAYSGPGMSAKALPTLHDGFHDLSIDLTFQYDTRRAYATVQTRFYATGYFWDRVNGCGLVRRPNEPPPASRLPEYCGDSLGGLDPAGKSGSLVTDDDDAVLPNDPAVAACSGGDASACRRVAEAFQIGSEEAHHSRVRVLEFLKKGCSARDPGACDAAADLMDGNHHLPADPAGQLSMWSAGCALKASSSCNSLGLAYQYGRGTPKDPTRAATVFDQACAGGDGLPCDWLGQLLRDGDDGFPKNATRAIAMFNRSCSLKWADGCAHAGRDKEACANETPVTESCDKLCRAGDAKACDHASAEVQAEHEHERAVAKAERALPGLFAKCSAIRARLEPLRVAGVAAERRGDAAGLQRAQEGLEKLAPEWSSTLGEIRQDIQLVTGDEGSRFVDLMKRVDRECSCKTSASGRCR